MGQYQTRTSKTLDEEQGLGDEEGTDETQPSDVPPVFGSPIENESFLSNITETDVDKFHKISEILDSVATTETEKEEPDLELVVKEERTIPIVFRWDSGGSEIYICGSFNAWEAKIPLTNSHGDFTAIVELPKGRHEYKFFVDGQWLHDPNEPAVDNGLGSYNNVVNVSKKEFDAYFETWDILSDKASDSSPRGSYSQLMPPRSATSGLPPHLPPLLQQTILNQEAPSQDDAIILPEPNHVILNHLFALSIKDNVLVMAATQRHKEKYVTTLMYKPV